MSSKQRRKAEAQLHNELVFDRRARALSLTEEQRKIVERMKLQRIIKEETDKAAKALGI